MRVHWILPLLLLGTLAWGQDDEAFKDLIEEGNYSALADRLEANLELDKADPALKTYLQFNLDYLRQGAPVPAPGEEIVVIRGIKTDTLYDMPPSSGGQHLLLPPGIRFSQQPWNERLAQIGTFFSTATTSQGGVGDVQHELVKVIRRHASSSDGSVLVSASTLPQQGWGPPFAIIRVPAERAIFNYTSPFTNEREVLIPFFVLPHEILAVVNTIEEATSHPAVQASPFQDLLMSYHSQCPGVLDALVNPVWEVIEGNIRAQEPPLFEVVAEAPACQAPQGGLAQVVATGGTTSAPAPAADRGPARKRVQIGVPYSASVTNDEEHWYAVDLVAGQRYSFRTSATFNSQGSSPLDTTLTLIDVDGSTLLDYNDDGPDGVNSQIPADPAQEGFRPLTSGTYYLVVGQTQATSGEYVLTPDVVSAAALVGAAPTIDFHLGD